MRFSSLCTCTVRWLLGNKNLKIAWLVYGRKMFVLFSRMSGDGQEALENRNIWFQRKYLHEIFSRPAALCEYITQGTEGLARARAGREQISTWPSGSLNNVLSTAGIQKADQRTQFLRGHFCGLLDQNMMSISSGLGVSVNRCGLGSHS